MNRLRSTSAVLALLIVTAVALDAQPTPQPTSLPAADEIYMPELDNSRGVLRLYGTRGSVPVPGAAVARYGGNTSCLEVRHGTDVVIIDAGTGIRECGIDLAKQGPRPLHLFVGHTHWDHIQGFPFFAPAYIPGFELSVYGASGFRKDLKSIFQGQLDYDYFPVDMRDMRATMTFATLDASPVRIGNINVHWEWAIHPGATVCFKIEIGGLKIGYVTDNEFLRGYLGHPAKALGATDMLSPYRAIIDFFTGVDILIGEAQYTNEEYLKKIGWGHTSISNACVLAALTGVRKWIVTHHDPIHDGTFHRCEKQGVSPMAWSPLAGGQLFGFSGVLLALPVAAVLMVLLRYAHERYVNSYLYDRSPSDP